MPAVVIDTNVLVVANDQSDQAGPDCVLACVAALEQARNRDVVLVDGGLRIFDEYRRHASLSGQPGAGDAFFKWLWNNQANFRHCCQVMITPREGDPDDFEEFPENPELTQFDRSDRKFVAVAVGSGLNPAILNATDSDWWDFRKPLADQGIRLEFLCPDLFEGRASS